MATDMQMAKHKQMKMFPKSDDFAVLLGFRKSHTGTPPARTEQHKVDIMNMLYIPRLLMERELQQEVIFSRFCALYLPQLVEQYLAPPEPSPDKEWQKSILNEDMKLANAYGYLLVHLNGNPYFDRFFRLAKHREIRLRLITVLLERLLERTTPWEQREAKPKQSSGGVAVKSMVYDYCQLTYSILLFESEEETVRLASTSFVQDLLPFLDWWEQRYNPCNANLTMQKSKSRFEQEYSPTQESASEDIWPPGTLALILRNGKTPKERKAVRESRYDRQSIQICGLPGCNKSYATDGGALLQCSKCSTVRYCSAEHQIQAWSHGKTMHREMCYSPVY